MTLVEYDRNKLLRRAGLFGVVGIAAMGSIIGALLGLYLLFNALGMLRRALSSNRAAMVLHATELEVRTLWQSKRVPYDAYLGIKAETIFFHIALLPIPGPAMLVVKSAGGLFGQRKLRLPIGYLALVERAVPMIAEAVEMFVVAHRAGGKTWEKAWNEKTAREARLGHNLQARELRLQSRLTR